MYIGFHGHYKNSLEYHILDNIHQYYLSLKKKIAFKKYIFMFVNDQSRRESISQTLANKTKMFPSNVINFFLCLKSSIQIKRIMTLM